MTATGPTMQVVSAFGPFGDDDPFAGMAAMFSQLMGAFGGGGSMGWEHAKQFAGAIANEGESEPNVDPVERMQVEQLAGVAELQVTQATGLSIPSGGHGLVVSPVNRTQWTAATLDAYRPLF